MMNKNIITGIIVVLVVIGGIIYVSSSGGSNSMTTNTNTTTTSTTTTDTTTSGGKSFTLAQVATHNNQTSCYTTVRGNVYDLTSWISQHPGGEGAILSLCGKDGTSAFEAQHGNQRRPNNELDSLLIGTLAK